MTQPSTPIKYRAYDGKRAFTNPNTSLAMLVQMAAYKGSINQLLDLVERGAPLDATTPHMHILNAALAGYREENFGFQDVKRGGGRAAQQREIFDAIVDVYLAAGGDAQAWLDSQHGIDRPLHEEIKNHLAQVVKGALPRPSQESLAAKGIELNLLRRSREIGFKQFDTEEAARRQNGVYFNEDALRSEDIVWPSHAVDAPQLQGRIDPHARQIG